MSITFFVNFSVFMSTNSARTAFTYDLKLSNVTRPEPMGYLFLSVSIPGIFTYNHQTLELYLVCKEKKLLTSVQHTLK